MASTHGTVQMARSKTHKHDNITAGSKLTLVQRVFPDPFPRAGDITLLLGKASLPLLGGEGDGFSSAVLLPLQLSNGVWGIGGFELTVCKCQAFVDKFELGSEHVLLLNELVEGVVVLVIVRDVGDEPKLVGSDGGVAELLEVCSLPDEHMMEPGG